MKNLLALVRHEIRVASFVFFLSLTCGACLSAGCGKRSSDEAPMVHSETATAGLASAQLPAEHLDRIIEQFNRGIALMEQYQPAAAVDASAAVDAAAAVAPPAAAAAAPPAAAIAPPLSVVPATVAAVTPAAVAAPALPAAATAGTANRAGKHI